MDATFLGENHFLSLPRPDPLTGPQPGAPDTTTLAAHDFDVDTRTGFMPPQQPLMRLPEEWSPWEEALDSAIGSKLQLGDKPGVSEEDRAASESWRQRIRELPILPTKDLKKSEVLLRRAHLVLAWIMHFYIHTLPPSSPIRIPAPITVPLLQVSQQLQLPPVVTYSDDVLYNWKFIDGKEKDEYGNDIMPTTTNIDCQTLFTSTRDEAEFYLTSARMELKGVDALDLMRNMMDEMFVGDDIAIRRITTYLEELSEVIKELGDMLLAVKDVCQPQVFYDEIRPWFRGEDSTSGQRWEFEGLELDETLTRPTELSGASAGQSSLVHTLDVFLGVDKYSHSKESEGSSRQPRSSFLKRMQEYMPRHHRAFLNHLAHTPRPLRDFVLSKSKESPDGEKLLQAYNAAVQELKVFRDKHMIIVALYIIGPARRREAGTRDPSSGKEELKGTGGTNMVQFLKGVRDQTRGALLS
ncbi:hypothetical protein NMY22_g3624 [Coprinellus aureogranulatus]|nr:hypothetical protein NMY22_g3624 [Coprinellus aureogranulatus]